jgi:hypothetical protein
MLAGACAPRSDPKRAMAAAAAACVWVYLAGGVVAVTASLCCESCREVLR